MNRIKALQFLLITYHTTNHTTQVKHTVFSGPTTSYAFTRLELLSAKFNFHILLNGTRELNASKSVPHRDFYNVRKVDTHVHHSVRVFFIFERKIFWFACDVKWMRSEREDSSSHLVSLILSVVIFLCILNQCLSSFSHSITTFHRRVWIKSICYDLSNTNYGTCRMKL